VRGQSSHKETVAGASVHADRQFRERTAAFPVVLLVRFRETERMDDDGQQVIEQRIRNRIIEYLELASSFDA
jgi:hypothetical protein